MPVRYEKHEMPKWIGSSLCLIADRQSQNFSLFETIFIETFTRNIRILFLLY